MYKSNMQVHAVMLRRSVPRMNRVDKHTQLQRGERASIQTCNIYIREKWTNSDCFSMKSMSEQSKAGVQTPIEQLFRQQEALMRLPPEMIKDLQIPIVVVVGGQSSGKSSLHCRIIGNKILATGTGTVTLCPIQLWLETSSTESVTFNDSLIKEEQLLAKIEDYNSDLKQQGKMFDSIPIRIGIKGPKVPRLILYDLPGLIAAETPDQKAIQAKQKIQAMIQEYLNRPNIVVLLVGRANDQPQSNMAIQLLRNSPRESRQILMVITHLDRVEGSIFDLKNTYNKLVKDLNISSVSFVITKDFQSGQCEKMQLQKLSKNFRSGEAQLIRQQTVGNLILQIMEIMKQSMVKFFNLKKPTILASIQHFKAEQKQKLNTQSSVRMMLKQFRKQFLQQITFDNTEFSHEIAIVSFRKQILNFRQKILEIEPPKFIVEEMMCLNNNSMGIVRTTVDDVSIRIYAQIKFFRFFRSHENVCGELGLKLREVLQSAVIRVTDKICSQFKVKAAIKRKINTQIDRLWKETDQLLAKMLEVYSGKPMFPQFSGSLNVKLPQFKDNIVTFNTQWQAQFFQEQFGLIKQQIFDLCYLTIMHGIHKQLVDNIEDYLEEIGQDRFLEGEIQKSRKQLQNDIERIEETQRILQEITQG